MRGDLFPGLTAETGDVDVGAGSWGTGAAFLMFSGSRVILSTLTVQKNRNAVKHVLQGRFCD